MANGKSKGSGFEREVAKFLSKWMQGTEKPYIFWRTPASGAMQTIHSDENMSGDIIAVRSEGKWLTDTYSIEIKNGYSNTSLDKFFKYNKSDPLKSFWSQCVNDANESEKYPMLIYKKKGMSTLWIGIDVNSYNNLKNYLSKLRGMTLQWSEDDNLPFLYLYEMKEFFNNITPDILKELIYEHKT